MLRAYLITDPLYYSSSVNVFKEKLETTLSAQNVEYVCFRDKTSPNFEELAATFVSICKKHNIRNIFINSNIDLAHSLGADGVHLTSRQFDLIPQAKAKKLHVIVSTHNDEEIAKAEKLGADLLTYSPIFETPNKGNPKGLEDLKDKVDKIRTKIIALGGIVTKEHINEVEKTGAYAFASIRYFIDN